MTLGKYEMIELVINESERVYGIGSVIGNNNHRLKIFGTTYSSFYSVMYVTPIM